MISAVFGMLLLLVSVYVGLNDKISPKYKQGYFVFLVITVIIILVVTLFSN